jgi:competence protein ComEC
MEFLRSKKFMYMIGILVACNVLAWTGVFHLLQSTLEVVFLDVGQGDAVLVKTPQGRTILIDGGPEPVVLEKLGRELPFWERSIDVVLLTHPHFDHYRGLLDVVEHYSVSHVIWTGVRTDPGMFDGWHHLLSEKDTNVVIARQGITLRFGTMPRCDHIQECKIVLEILHPFEDLEGTTSSHLDNTSVVAQLRAGDISFLFTGDAFQEIEYDLIEEYGQMFSSVLHVGHHGSSTSTSTPFLYAVQPEIAVIQAGKNNTHGHPHLVVLEKLESLGIDILRTDVHGSVSVRTDGEKISVSSEYE